MNKIQSWKPLDVDFQPNVDVQVYFCKFYDKELTPSAPTD